ncbi:hypothetical protein K431DRAFT_350583 [Polychaeton citri CBS 116435]|uniref:Uncharacterized protein n=1 Tax=Polychaeton citri CBS 116435 TaxID=1314669 RepID=A0A9P4UHT3_9PEZI|nr:hypothetical protein K431DRAFT_350583 [Polychaeton citri CBS 116435]
MFNYILSALGLASAANHDNDKDQGNVSMTTASCRGWSGPDPAVRLRRQDNSVVRIFGFPEEGNLLPGFIVPPIGMGNGLEPMLHLRGAVPAYVDYIMGYDWQSRLRDYQIADGHTFKNGKVILREDGEDERGSDERNHCLRMRRCGAFGIRSEVDIILDETNGRFGPRHGYAFGWPAEGGVWVLRQLPAWADELDSAPIGSHLEEDAAMDEMQQRFSIATSSFKEQDDMEGICRVIEEAGGRFYLNIGDCPEAVELGLLE